MSMKITFPGGVAVNAAFKGFTVATDQKAETGGGAKAAILRSVDQCAVKRAITDPPRFEVAVAGVPQPETVEA